MTRKSDDGPKTSSRRTVPRAGDTFPTLTAAAQQFSRLFRLIRPYWGSLGQGLLLGFVVGLVGMIVPYLSKLLIDEVYPSGNVTLMHVIVGGLAAVGMASAMMGGIRGYFSQIVAARLDGATTLLFFNHLQHLPVRFFEEHRVGEIMSRFQDVRRSLGAVSKVIETLFVRGVYLVLVPPILFLLNWKLALVALVAVPLTAGVATVSARWLRRYWKRSAESHADLHAYQVEVLSNISMLKSMAIEPQLFRKAARQTEQALQHQLTASGLGTAVATVNGVLRTAATVLTTWFAWTLIISNEMTLGSYIAFIAYLAYLTGPINQIVSLFASLQQSAVTLDRMFEYLDAEPEQDPSTAYGPAPPIVTRLGGNLRLRHVSFGYTPDRPVLKGLSVELFSGEIVAVVGPSGAGKSSLLRLLCGMERPKTGELEFDGRSASTISVADLRRQVAVVWQNPGMLQGTVWYNLVAGVENPPRALVDRAVKICRLESVIDELPMRYETPVAEWGASLSGGQRQRLAIARALIRDTPFILLDEATSNIDVETEADILRDLFLHFSDRTILFATHRLSNARLADRVLVLQDGMLAASGRHADLIQTSDIYRQLQLLATNELNGVQVMTSAT